MIKSEANVVQIDIVVRLGGIFCCKRVLRQGYLLMTTGHKMQVVVSKKSDMSVQAVADVDAFSYDVTVVDDVIEKPPHGLCSFFTAYSLVC